MGQGKKKELWNRLKGVTIRRVKQGYKLNEVGRLWVVLWESIKGKKRKDVGKAQRDIG